MTTRTPHNRRPANGPSVLAILAGLALGGVACAQDEGVRLIDPVDAALSTPRANAPTDEHASDQDADDDLLAGPRVRAEVIPGAGQSFGEDTDPLMRGARVPLRTFLDAVRQLTEPATPEAARMDRATAALLLARSRSYQQEVTAYWQSVSGQVREIRRVAGLGQENRTAAQRAGGSSESRARVAQEVERLQRELRQSAADRPANARDDQPDDAMTTKPEPGADGATDTMTAPAMTDAMSGPMTDRVSDTMTGTMGGMDEMGSSPTPDPRTTSARALALDQLAQLRRQAPSDVGLRSEIWERLNDAQRDRVVQLIEERFRREYEERNGVRLRREGETAMEGLTPEAIRRGDFDDRLFNERTRDAIDRLSGVARDRALERARERAVRTVFENDRENRYERPEPPSIDEVLGVSRERSPGARED